MRKFRSWVDPSSYRPLFLLVVISLVVFLMPLALDVGYVLFFMLPYWFRKSLGQGILLALIAAGLWRLWRVRPGIGGRSNRSGTSRAWIRPRVGGYPGPCVWPWSHW